MDTTSPPPEASRPGARASSFPRGPRGWIAAWLALDLALYLSQSLRTPVCSDDCAGYVELMGHVGRGDYVATLQAVWRGWFVPVVFSLFGAYGPAAAARIVLAQSVVLFVAWIVFARVVSSAIGGPRRVAVFLALTLMPYAHHHFRFNAHLLSDALGMATLLLFLACVVGQRRLAERVGPDGAVLVTMLAAACTAGARDSNLMWVLLGAAYVSVVHGRWMGLRRVVLAVASLAAVVALQLPGARARHSLTAEHVLAGFVLPTPEIKADFVRYGMPAELGRGGALEPQPWRDARLEGMTRNLQQVSLDDDVLAHASGWQLRWWATHPGYLARQAWADADLILGQRSDDPSVITLAPTDLVGPRLRVVLALVVCAACLALRRRVGAAAVQVVLLLCLGGLANAVSSYFADLWTPGEMARHALVGATMSSAGTWLGAVVLAVNARASFGSPSRGS